MTMNVPSTGDILLLSQIAWKIGRAFTAGRKNAPSEFQDVEREIGGLAKTLKQLAETLHVDVEQNFLRSTDTDVQRGVATILTSCQRSVNDLDSLLDQYQVVRKHRTVGGFAIERSWSDVVLVDYKKLMWTAEGGDIHTLRDLLQMHSCSISLLIHGLQSNSPSRLEKVVAPMANRIDSMYHSDATLGQSIEDIHHLLQELSVTERSTQTPPIPMRNPARSPTIEATNPLNIYKRPASSGKTSPRNANTVISLPKAPQRCESPDYSSPPRPSSSRKKTSSTDTTTCGKTTLPTQKRVSEFSVSGSSIRYSSSSYASSTASSGIWSQPGTPRDSLLARQPSTSTKKTSPLPRTPEVREPGDRSSDATLSLLPPPALGLSAPYELDKFSSRSTLSPYPHTQPEITKLHRSSTTASQRAAFEKDAFRNSAILCDVRGRLVEYSHQINEEDPKDVEMIQASEECRVAVVRKRVHDAETKTVRVVTSIWTFSDDNTIRMELRMDDQQMYIPYSSYFSPNKVSITVPCELKFHDVKHSNRPVKMAKTSWVNYVFDTPQAATLFQNEIMGRTLLATFRTEKTMRIHEGISKSFSYAEQMCGLENLRVWEDNDTGAIIALIHFSADFRDGYLAFYINSSVNPIKVKDDSNREVKIKGLKVPIDRGDRAMRKDSLVPEKGKGREGEQRKVEKEKVISGAKIEFATDMEKKEFLAMVKEMQRDMIELPDLLGVN